MATSAIDSYKLLSTLKATGKDSNFTAEELVNAIGVAQEGADLVTVAVFDAKMNELRAELRADMKELRADMKELRADKIGRAHV